MPKYPAHHDATEPPALLDTPELNRVAWDRAASRMLAKMLGEFAYEEVIEPAPRTAGGSTYTLPLDDGGSLSFTATRGVYGSWRVDPGSIREEGPDPAGGSVPFRDPLLFVTRARRLLGLDGATLGHLLRELTTTLAAGTTTDWVNESHKLAMTWHTTKKPFNDDYVTSAVPVIEERLLLAGLRLARLIEEAVKVTDTASQ